MFVLRSYLVAMLVCLPALSFAELPSDADRGVDVELAGFLYTQGVYKNRIGNFVLLDQVDESEYEASASGPVDFPDSTSNNQRIDDWIRSTDTKISFTELLDQ